MFQHKYLRFVKHILIRNHKKEYNNKINQKHTFTILHKAESLTVILIIQ